jgi:hypothetical protein
MSMRLTKLLIVLAATFFSGLAAAGMKTNYATYVSAGYVFASLSSARYSSNTLEYLSCDLYSSGYISCSARDASGNSAWCSTDTTAQPTFAAMILAMNSASAVAFWFDPSTHVCTSLFVRGGSNLLP